MKKTIASGIPHTNEIAPKKKGAFIKVQNRTIATAKKSKQGACVGCSKKK